MKYRSKRFTLIELLVVIGIIGILVTLLLPALASARRTAKRAVCLSNLHQVGLTYSLYHGDNSGRYPIHKMWNDIHGQKGTNVGIYNNGLPVNERPLNKYGNVRIAECPSDNGEKSKWGETNVPLYQAYGTSYLPTWRYSNFYATLNTSDNTNPKYVDGFDQISRKIVMGDWNWHTNRKTIWDQNIWHNINRKTNKSNMLWGDGHAVYFTSPFYNSRGRIRVDLDRYGFY